jgi:hypothetical protein
MGLLRQRSGTWCPLMDKLQMENGCLLPSLPKIGPATKCQPLIARVLRQKWGEARAASDANCARGLAELGPSVRIGADSVDRQWSDDS